MLPSKEKLFGNSVLRGIKALLRMTVSPQKLEVMCFAKNPPRGVFQSVPKHAVLKTTWHEPAGFARVLRDPGWGCECRMWGDASAPAPEGPPCSPRPQGVPSLRGNTSARGHEVAAALLGWRRGCEPGPGSAVPAPAVPAPLRGSRRPSSDPPSATQHLQGPPSSSP